MHVYLLNRSLLKFLVYGHMAGCTRKEYRWGYLSCRTVAWDTIQYQAPHHNPVLAQKRILYILTNPRKVELWAIAYTHLGKLLLDVENAFNPLNPFGYITLCTAQKR